MKKLISILAAIGITATAAGSTVSCRYVNQNSNTKINDYKDDSGANYSYHFSSFSCTVTISNPGVEQGDIYTFNMWQIKVVSFEEGNLELHFNDISGLATLHLGSFAQPFAIPEKSVPFIVTSNFRKGLNYTP